MKYFALFLTHFVLVGLFFAPTAGQRRGNAAALKGREEKQVSDESRKNEHLARLMNIASRKNAPGGNQADAAVGQNARVFAADGTASDWFGDSAAISGNTVIVGQPSDDGNRGAAYIYVRTAAGWIQQAKILASDGVAGDRFGSSVAIFGTTVVVGADSDDETGTDRGSAYVFVNSAGIWTEQAKLLAGDGSMGDRFGASVAVYSETVVVGAPEKTGSGASQGAAYVFERTGVSWVEQAKLTALDGTTGDRFGAAVSVTADTAAVGAPTDDVVLNTDQGSAYIFTRSAAIWTENSKLTAADGATGDRFGSSVSIGPGTVAVGAPRAAIGINPQQGAAYVFAESGLIWSFEGKLTAIDGRAGDNFGHSVGFAGQTTVVGAPLADVGSHADQGATYVFGRNFGVWSSSAKLLASDGRSGDTFGTSVGVSGEITVGGAPGVDFGAQNDQGAAYIFRNLNTSWALESRRVANDGQADDSFGSGVAISGDIAVVGSYRDDGTFVNEGAAYVYTRSGNTWTQQAKLLPNDPQAGAFFGFSVAIYGETIVVGSHLRDETFVDQGAVYIFVKSGATWVQQAKLLPSDPAADDIFGFSVSIFGDTVAVGSTFDDATFVDQGSAYVFVRSGTTWSQQAKLVSSTPAFEDVFARSVDIHGDTVVIGGDLADGPAVDQGAALVFVRNGATWSEQARLLAPDGANGDQFGQSVTVSGDTIVVGASLAHAPLADQGAAYVFVRNGATWSLQTKITAIDAEADDLFGYSASLEDNLLVIGSVLDDGALPDEGGAYVYVRNGSVWNFQQKLNRATTENFELFGFSSAISGDRVMIGAVSSDSPTPVPFSSTTANLAPNQGAAYFFSNFFVPTAARLTVSGRVVDQRGAGVRNALVTLTDGEGRMRQIRTGSFGYFTFDDLQGGQIVIIGAQARQMVFEPQVINLTANVADLILTNGGGQEFKR